MKTGDLFEANTAAPDSARRIVPEGNRYRWEQQWLQENRRVSGVIDNDARTFDATAASASAPQQMLATESRAQLQPMIAPPVIGVAQSVGTGVAASIGSSAQTAADNKAVSASPAFDVAAPRHAVLSDAAIESGAPELDNVNPALSSYKREQKNFAIWRGDDEIKISMRLSQSEPEQAATLNVLRRWLKDLGLKLTSLMINGRERAQLKPSIHNDR